MRPFTTRLGSAAAALAGATLFSLFSLAALVTALVTAPGCATTTGPAFRPAFLEGDENVMYLFRSPSSFNGSEVNVFVNQEFVGTLRAGEYLAHTVPPGEYLVRVEAVSSSVARVELGGGESAYLLVKAAGINPTPVIEIKDAEEGVDLITTTRQAPEHTTAH